MKHAPTAHMMAHGSKLRRIGAALTAISQFQLNAATAITVMVATAIQNLQFPRSE